MNLYTFGLLYDKGTEAESLEEIDVIAGTAQDARQEALRIARDGYQPGWELVELPPGGSGGLVLHF